MRGEVAWELSACRKISLSLSRRGRDFEVVLFHLGQPLGEVATDESENVLFPYSEIEEGTLRGILTMGGRGKLFF